jgi:hypothetical protein
LSYLALEWGKINESTRLTVGNMLYGTPNTAVVTINGRHVSVTIAHRHFFYVPHLEF